MPYINTIDINGEVYHVANLTDGEHVVDLPQLNDNDIFLVRGDIIDSLTSSVSSKPLSAKQGKILNDVISQLKADVGGKDNARKDVTDEFKTWAQSSGSYDPYVFSKTLENGKYLITQNGDQNSWYDERFEIDVFTVANAKWRVIKNYNEEFFNIDIYCGDNHVFILDEECQTLEINGQQFINEGFFPIPTSSDNGKVLRVVNGTATWVSLPSASGVSF